MTPTDDVGASHSDHNTKLVGLIKYPSEHDIVLQLLDKNSCALGETLITRPSPQDFGLSGQQFAFDVQKLDADSDQSVCFAARRAGTMELLSKSEYFQLSQRQFQKQVDLVSNQISDLGVARVLCKFNPSPSTAQQQAAIQQQQQQVANPVRFHMLQDFVNIIQNLKLEIVELEQQLLSVQRESLPILDKSRLQQQYLKQVSIYDEQVKEHDELQERISQLQGQQIRQKRSKTRHLDLKTQYQQLSQSLPMLQQAGRNARQTLELYSVQSHVIAKLIRQLNINIGDNIASTNMNMDSNDAYSQMDAEMQLESLKETEKSLDAELSYLKSSNY